MTAQDYAINFPYGATDPPYGTAALPYHRGDDRPCPPGTPVVINGVTIGHTGATGLADGPHLHIQEWQGSVTNTRKPQNSFKGGSVTNVGTASQWGNFVTVTGSDGWNTTYCHLSSYAVGTGKVLANNTPAGGNEDMIKPEDRDLLHKLTVRLKLWQEPFDMDKEMRAWTGQDWRKFLSEGMNEAAGRYNQLQASAQREADLASSNTKLSEANVKLSVDINQERVNHAQQVSAIKSEYEQKLAEATGKTVYVENPETGKKLDAILTYVKSIWGSVTSLHKKIK